MREIERKLRIEPAERERIAGFCARERFEILGETAQTDIYFTLPNRDIYKEDMALRVRTEQVGERKLSFLTFKGKGRATAFHDREEIETSVDDGEKLTDILHALDFRKVLTVKKKRMSYRNKSVTVSLDEVDGLGHFVEVEYAAEDTDVGQELAIATIDRLIGKMGLETAVNEPKNYLQLLVAEMGKEGGS
jgi:adenylate cyclase class 2